MGDEAISTMVERLQQGDQSAFAELIAQTAQQMRLLVATHVATIAQVDQSTRDIYAAVKHDINVCPIENAPTWMWDLARTYLTKHLNEPGVREVMSRDPLVNVVYEAGLVSLANPGEHVDVAARLSQQLNFQPPSLQLLLKRHYGEGMSVSNLAQAQGLGEDDIAQSLVSARARIDWTGSASVIDTADETFPKLIEDVMGGTIAPDARALLVSSIVQDEQRAKQFVQQMRIHLYLTVVFTPFDKEAIQNIVKAVPGGRPATGRVARKTDSGSRKTDSGSRKTDSDAARPRRTTEVRPSTRPIRRSEVLGGSRPPGDHAEHDVPRARQNAPSRNTKKQTMNLIIGGIVALIVIGVVVVWATSGGEKKGPAQLTTVEQPTHVAPGEIQFGVVIRSDGNGSITRQGQTIQAVSGELIASGDSFSTRGNASLGTLIGDQVRLTLGNDTTVSKIAQDGTIVSSAVTAGKLGADIRQGPNVSNLVVTTPQSRIEQLDAGSLIEVEPGITRVRISRGSAKISRADGSEPIEAKAGSVVLIRDGVAPTIEGGGVFVRGINFGLGRVTIEGNAWLSQEEAQGAGLTLAPGTKQSKPAYISGQGLDFDSKRMYDTGLVGESGTLGFTQLLPDGDYNIDFWFAGPEQVTLQGLMLEIDGKQVSVGPAAEKAEHWRRVGPFRVTAQSGKLRVALSGLQNIHLAGMALSAVGELKGSMPPMVLITSPSPDADIYGTRLDIYARTSPTDDIEKIAFYNNDTLLGEVTKPPYGFSWTNAPTGSYALTAVATCLDGTSNRSPVVNGNITILGDTAGVLHEKWTGIGGRDIGSLTKSKQFLEGTPERSFVPNFNITPHGNGLGIRLRAYLTAPLDGEYIFKMCSDDGSQLQLSPTESPANAVTIASLADYADPGSYDKYPTQISKPIRLEKGKRYYIEALLKQGMGSAFLVVGWKRPDGKEQNPIPASVFSPCDASLVATTGGTPTTTPALPKGTDPVPTPPVRPLVEPDAPAGPCLIAAGAASPPIVNIAEYGNSDWIHYGAKDATTHNRRGNGTFGISAAKGIDDTEVKHLADSPTKIAWTGGWPEKIMPGSTGAIIANKNSKGLQFSAKADDKLRELRIWCGAHNAKGTLTVSLSDKSANQFTGVVDASRDKDTYQTFVIRYRAKESGQRLKVTFEPSSGRGRDKGYVALQAVALAEFDDGARQFVTGVNLEGNNQTLGGHQWLGQKEAEAQGLTVSNSRRVSIFMEPKPDVDDEVKKMLNTGVAAKGGDIQIEQKLPNGRYEVQVYVMETGSSKSRLFDLQVNDKLLSDIGQLDKGSWKAYGPIKTVISSGKLSIQTVPKKGNPQLMGFDVWVPARRHGPYTNAFPDGEPHAIPGTIIAADFDRGPEGQAFQDGKASNEGGYYRDGNVDIVDHEGVPVIGYTLPGEWWRYTTQVTEAGTYAMSLEVSRKNKKDPKGETYRIQIDGKDVGTPAALVDTGDYAKYTTISLGSVALTPGIHDVRLIIDGISNVKTITFTKQ